MSYTVTCSCGSVLLVAATQAGSTLECSNCGQSVKVPRLSALRVAAGESAIPLNAAERVNQAVTAGKLPSNLLCPVTGGKADAIAVFRIHCEQTWKKGQDASAMQLVLWFMFFGWLGLLFAWVRGKPEKEVLGRDMFIDAPLRVSTAALQQLSRQRNQRSLRDLLAGTPEYAAVFVEFPGAQISFNSGVAR